MKGEPLKRLNCDLCGRFMKKLFITDHPLEDEVSQVWKCLSDGNVDFEHLYFKSELKKGG